MNDTVDPGVEAPRSPPRAVSGGATTAVGEVLPGELLAFIAGVRETPHAHDLWQVLRVIDARQGARPLLGRALRPRDEPIRIGQEASLAFAPTQITGVGTHPVYGRPRISILGFGLFGPNGPLPIHLTEYARGRVREHDEALVHFCDILHHRFALLFYRAWADVQATVSLDRGTQGQQEAGYTSDAFSRYIASLVHLGDPALRDRDTVPDHAKLFVAGHLVRQARNAEGLQKLLHLFFRTAVEVEQWVNHWLPLATEQRTRLGAGRPSEQLGVGAVAGAKVPDVQSKFRVRIGPLALRDYEQHLPGGRFFAQVLAWVRNYVGIELEWDVRLVLARNEVPRAALGGNSRLGWTTWMGERSGLTDADDLVLGHEEWIERSGVVRRAAA